MNSNSVSILEIIEEEQQQKKLNNIGGVDFGDDGSDNNRPIESPETAIQKLKDAPFDLKKNINCEQKINVSWTTTPMIAFCRKGDILMCRFLQQHGASCTKRDREGRFPMYTAALNGKIEICQWLHNDCGDAKFDVNQEKDNIGWTPLSESIDCGYVLQSKWFISHGGAQQVSERAVRLLRSKCRYSGGREIIAWARMNIAFHDITFFLFLCGASSTTSCTSTSTPNPSTTLNHPDCYLPLLNGQPGVMELIGHYTGLIYGTKIRMLQEFIVKVE